MKSWKRLGVCEGVCGGQECVCGCGSVFVWVCGSVWKSHCGKNPAAWKSSVPVTLSSSARVCVSERQ